MGAVGLGDHRGRSELIGRMGDARSRRVVFVSHCLLNENVRFLGGATRPGAVAEAIEPYLADGVGIVQMPCPEQAAWGGVLKGWMLLLYGRRILRRRAARRLLSGVVRTVTRVRFARLARRTTALLADYHRSGFEILAVVGVGASPSCGVRTTLDLDGALAAMGGCDPRMIDPATVVSRVVAANVIEGQGVFVAGLRRRLAHAGLRVQFDEHDLLAELGASSTGGPSTGTGVTVHGAGRSPLAGQAARGSTDGRR